MNGNGKLSMYLIGILVMVNISLTGWTLVNIVTIRESVAAMKQQVYSLNKSQDQLAGQVREYHENKQGG